MILQTDNAAQYANQLLYDLGQAEQVNTPADHPAIAWRRSGCLGITGAMLPLPIASHMDGAMMALKAISPVSHSLPDTGSELLGERARLRGIHCKDRISAGGFGRLLDTASGVMALNLVRDEDWDLIPAWLEDDVSDWAAIARAVGARDRNSLVDRATEMGLAAAKSDLPPRLQTWLNTTQFTQALSPSSPLIVDLSALWAGPLASSLLRMTGARVVKVEGPQRPDGMRAGHKGFYDLINAGKDCVAIDFKEPRGLETLKVLLDKADIVIEASRPRALLQLGVIAEDFVRRKPGKIWARLTAYGRSENRIGFGDDIGVSAGLSSILAAAHGTPGFAGDAISDPINGLHLALAIQGKLRSGGGVIVDMSMKDTVRYAMGDIPIDPAQTARDWSVTAAMTPAPLYDIRELQGRVKAIGADNTALLC